MVEKRGGYFSFLSSRHITLGHTPRSGLPAKQAGKERSGSLALGLARASYLLHAAVMLKRLPLNGGGGNVDGKKWKPKRRSGKRDEKISIPD